MTPKPKIKFIPMTDRWASEEDDIVKMFTTKKPKNVEKPDKKPTKKTDDKDNPSTPKDI